MASDRNRQHLELERPSWPAMPYRDIQMQIGRAMKLQYELPHQLLTLLMQVTGREEND
jgi:hypothetical protein